MDLPVWFMVATVLFTSVHADPTNQRILPEEKTHQQQHITRQPRYEMKEVILYLTPTQIRALEAGQGSISQHLKAQHPHVLLNHHHQKEEVQHTLQGKGQQLQHEVVNLEANKQQPIQLQQEPVQTQHPKNENKQKIPQQEATPQLEVSHPGKYPEYAQQSQLVEKAQSNNKHYLSVQKPQFVPDNYAYLYFYPRRHPQNIEQHLHHPQAQDIQTNQHLLVQQERRPFNNLYNQKFHLVPYGYGSEKALESHQLHHSPETLQQQQHNILQPLIAHQQHNLQETLQQHLPSVAHDHHNLPEPLPQVAHQPHNLHEALPEPLPLVAHQLGIDQAHAQEMEIHKLQAHEFDLDQFHGHLDQANLLKAHLEAQNLDGQREAEHFNTHFKSYQLESNLDNEHLKAHQLKAHIEDQQVDDHDHHEHIHNHKLESHLEAQKLEGQLEAEQLKAHEFKTHFDGQLETDYFKTQFEAQKSEIQLEDKKPNPLKVLLEAQQSGGQIKLETEPFEIHQFKSYSGPDQLKGKLDAKRFKAIELKAHLEARQKLEAQKLEALRMDAHHEGQQLEAEVAKAEELKAKLESHHQEPQKFKSYHWERHPQPLRLFEPLLQHQGISEILKHKEEFEKNPPQFEHGFRPLKYAPKFDGEKYEKEIEKILKSIQFEKQDALSKTVEFSKDGPIVIHKKVKVEENPVHIIKHVDIPVPYYVPIPKPYEVKVPQPYSMPIEIINQIPIPIIKMEKVEVEKPVPYEVEKHVPVTVTKNVYVKVDKPYFVEKRVPIEVRKKIPYHKPQKFTIRRHVWKH